MVVRKGCHAFLCETGKKGRELTTLPERERERENVGEAEHQMKRR